MDRSRLQAKEQKKDRREREVHGKKINKSAFGSEAAFSRPLQQLAFL